MAETDTGGAPQFKVAEVRVPFVADMDAFNRSIEEAEERITRLAAKFKEATRSAPESPKEPFDTAVRKSSDTEGVPQKIESHEDDKKVREEFLTLERDEVALLRIIRSNLEMIVTLLQHGGLS